MAEDDWFRNKTWNAEIDAAFRAKLKRARDKQQYLRIQASTLAPTMPDVALSLLEEYFRLPVVMDNSQAWVDRAKALLSKGDAESAIHAYEAALAREQVVPNSLTQAYIDLPYMIASLRLTGHYERASFLLSEHAQRVMFPVDRFKWNAAQAILANEREDASAPVFARVAIEAAESKDSGFHYHRSAGLVGEQHSGVIKFLKRLLEE